MIEGEFDDSVSLVSISKVDLQNLVFEGRAITDRPKQLRLTILPGTTWVVPKVGEQWIVKRNGIYWHLFCKTDYQDQRRLLPQSEGMYAYGGTGMTHIMGSEIVLHGNVRVEGELVYGEKENFPEALDTEDPNAPAQKEAEEKNKETVIPITPTNFYVGASTTKSSTVELPKGKFCVVTLQGKVTSTSATTMLNIELGTEKKTVALFVGSTADLSETFFLKTDKPIRLTLTSKASTVNLSSIQLRVVEF